jgi:HK97 family phage portal protein
VTLIRAARAAFTESRSVESPSVPLTGEQLLTFVYGSDTAAAGVVVDERTSMTMSAVFRCVAVTAGVSSALPLHTFVPETKKRVPSPLLRNPHPEMTRVELWRLTYVHRLLWGNAYLQKIRTRAGEVKELWPVMPWRVKPGRVKRSAVNPWGKIFEVTDDDGRRHAMTPRDLMHIPGLGFDGIVGMSVIQAAAKNAIGLSLAAERSGSKFFARGAQLSGLLQTEQRLTQPQAEALQQRWEARNGGLDNAYKVAVMDSGAKFQPMTMPLKDAQFLETRRFQVPEIARFYGTPLFLLFETEKSTSWGTGLEQQAQGWVTFDLHPTWLAPQEQRIEKELFADAGVDRDVRYNVGGLLRGDSKARGEFYRVMREVGGLNADEIRDLEDREPIPGGLGEIYLSPANMRPLGADDEPDREPADPDTDPDDDQDPDGDPDGDEEDEDDDDG